MKRHKTLHGFSAPLSFEGRASLYGPPPWRFGGRTLSIFFRADEGGLRMLLPEPLQLSADPMCRVSFHELVCDLGLGVELPFTDPEYSQFKEVGLAIPAEFNGVRGDYNPFLWCDSDAEMAVGREVYGWPQKLGKIALTRVFPFDGVQRGTKFKGTLARHGARLVTATLEIERRAEVEELPRFEVFYTRRIIPSPEPNGPTLTQIVATKMERVLIGELWAGSATLNFGELEYEELYPLQPLDVVRGYYMTIEWVKPHGQIIHTEEILEHRK